MLREHVTTITKTDAISGFPSFKAHCSCGWEGKFYSVETASDQLAHHVARYPEDGPQPDVATEVTEVVKDAPAGIPRIAVQPQSQSVPVGKKVTFTVQAAGETPLLYQWQCDGQPITSGTEQSFTIPETEPGDSGAVFRVMVKNALGNVMSKDAVLTVTGGPQQPSQTVQTAPPNPEAPYNPEHYMPERELR